MASEEIDPQPHKYWPSVESLKAYEQKTYGRHYYLSTLPKPSIPFTEGRWNKSNNPTAIDKLLIIGKSDLTDKIKRSFFQAAVVSILLYGCTTWTLTKRLVKKLDGNYTRMLLAILNKSWRQHPKKHQLSGHLPPTTKTIQVRRTRHAGQCWISRDELISDVLLWTPTYSRAKAWRPVRTYIQQLCEDTGCSPENCQRQWTIRRSGERGSGISVLAGRHDDDVDGGGSLILSGKSARYSLF